MTLSMLSRRTFLTNAALASVAARAPFLSGQASPASVTVRTPSGALRGEKGSGINIFRGVPFAQPPVGPLRFRPSLPVKPWSGERDSTSFSASPVQTGEAGVKHSEDCLYLNIWAPETAKQLPVFVWIHGGGFTGGHSFEPVYDGTGFAREGIICVTVGYRLGVFGFLDLGPLLGHEYAGTANNALGDLIHALKWVQANIASFGGDPARVTIGGESAGAKLVDLLMGIPAAQPLFHQMISESGGAERVWPAATAAGVSEGYGNTWRSIPGNTNASLLTAAPDLLIASQKTFLDQWPQHFPLRAEIDGTLIPRLPVETIAAGSTRGKRLLIGTNKDESALFIGPHPAHDPTAADLGNLSLSRFDAVFERYKQIDPDLTPEQIRIRAVTAEEYWVPSIRVADAHLKGGGSAWMYRLDFAETAGRLKGYAYHSLDVGLVWDKPHAQSGDPEAEAALATTVHRAWTAFIRGEAPSAPGLPAWTEYKSGTRPTMLLDQQSRMEQQPQEAELRLWDRIL